MYGVEYNRNKRKCTVAIVVRKNNKPKGVGVNGTKTKRGN